VTKALEYVDKNVNASGGTAIDEALREALKLRGEKDRPFMVVFLTDGEPTIGERDPKKIIANASGAAAGNVRLFTFGVGNDVNVGLLDELSAELRGSSSYVVPKEDIEIKVSSFYARVASPVLTDLKLDFGGLDVYDVCPRKVGDLFRDQQLVVVGRYKGKGAQAVKLSGKLGAREKDFVYEIKAPEKDAANEFLPRIWAMRKVGQLMEDIRKHGESPELRNEVVRLSKLHGIMTPYTSWLVVEDERQLARGGPAPATRIIQEDFDRRRNEAQSAARPAPSAPGVLYAKSTGAGADAPAAEARAAMRESARGLEDSSGGALAFGSRDSFESDKRQREKFLGGKSGEAEKAAANAVLGGGGNESLANRKLAESEGLEADGTYALKDAKGQKLVQQVGGRAFYFADGKWIDGAFDGKAETVKVKYLSDEYFKLLQDKPELARFLALGSKVIVKSGEKFYEVTDKE
jgi:Ca-activated chloride channel family protein